MNTTARLVAALVAAFAGGTCTAADLSARVTQHEGWSGWRVPMVSGVGTPCCFDWHGHGRTAACELDGRNWNFGTSDDDPHPAASQDLDVYVHVTHGRIDRTRAFGSSCAVGGTEQVHEIDGVDPGASIALLSGTAEQAGSQDVADGAIATLALHADPSATAALTRIAGPAQPRKLREQALFWLAQARGAEGAKFVEQVATGNDDADLRANAVFALSQARGVDAYASIRRIAREDRSEHVREQALFWMAQMGDKRARDDIFAAIARETSPKVQEQAVFALSQLEGDAAATALIDVVRGDYPRKVKEKALFWLGQSGSDKALEFLDQMLTRSGDHAARR